MFAAFLSCESLYKNQDENAWTFQMKISLYTVFTTSLNSYKNWL